MNQFQNRRNLCLFKLLLAATFALSLYLSPTTAFANDGADSTPKESVGCMEAGSEDDGDKLDRRDRGVQTQPDPLE